MTVRVSSARRRAFVRALGAFALLRAMSFVAPALALVLLLSLAVVPGFGTGVLPPVQLAAAGVPAPPTALFTENFEHNADNTATGAKAYSNALGATPYVGVAGQSYTGSSSWVDGNRCNGLVMSYQNSTLPAWASTPLQVNRCSVNAGVQSYQGVRTLARAMGLYTGSGDSEHIVTSYTECASSILDGSIVSCAAIPAGPSNGIMFQTTSSIPVTPDRYYVFGVDTVYGNCTSPASATVQADDPQYQFQLVDGSGTVTNIGGALDGCRPSATRSHFTVTRPQPIGASTTMEAYVSSLVSSAFEYTGSSLGIRMYNNNGTTLGNDGGFDNIRVLDVTPTLDKAFSPSWVRPGGVSTLTFTVTNTSELQAKNDWSFTDALPSGLAIAGTPNVGGTCANVTGAAYAVSAPAGGSSIGVTGGDLALGQASCTVTVDVTAATAGTYTNGPSNVTTPLNPPGPATLTVSTPSISLDKQAGPVVDLDGNGPDAGDTIAYTFLVTNTGAITLTTVGVTDPKVGSISCPATTLAPGASTTCTAAPYVVTQADVNAANVHNLATASGLPPNGPAVTASDFTDTAIPAAPAVGLVKKAGSITDLDGNGPDAGDTVAYTFDVTNTGNLALTNVAVSDPKVGAITCPVTTLAPGATTTCTAASYVLTQADVNAGKVVNTATASGLPPSGPTVTSPPSSVTVPIPAAPALALQKTVASIADANADGQTDAGDLISWTFKVTNTGNVTATNVAVSDPKAGPVSCPVTTLLPGASTTCTAGAYTITQAEGDAGIVTNTATATGQTPTGAPITSNPSSTSTPLTRTPVVTLTKSAAVTDVNGDGKNDLGDTIRWSFLVKNTGNVTVNPISVSDPKAGPVTCPVTTLAPGAATTCTATTAYTVTQADVDAGLVTNTATASGTPPTGPPVTSPPSSTTTPIAATSALQLTKSASVNDVNGDGLNDLGDRIQWSFLVKNTGTTTVTTVAVTDPTAGATSCLATTLAPGATTTCTATATHAVTQADVDAGIVSNTATASAKNPSGGPVTSNPSTTDTPVVQTTGLALLKSAAVSDVNGDGRTDLGDQVTWSFTVTNTGTVTLTTVAVTDPTAGAVTCPVTTLAPGGSTTCTAAAHVITQADVDAGHVDNTATASAKNPSGTPVPSNPSSTTTPVTQSEKLGLVKSATVTDVDGDGKTDLGDRVRWSFTVTNTGTVTLTTLAVADPTAGAITCPVTTLAPGASTTCTSAAHVITQADVDAGVVNNTATATAKNPSGTPVPSNPSSTTTPVVQTAALQLTKSAAVNDVNGNGANDLGDTIQWSFLVKNTGTTTVSTVAVADAKAGAVTCPLTTLPPGGSTTCTATTAYVITQTDVDAGVVSNVAQATGKSPTNATVTSNTSRTDTPVVQVPKLRLTKSAAVTDVNGDGRTDLGDHIGWTFLVENTGSVTVTTLAISDPKAGPASCPVTTLAPGASTTCTATTAYVVTQADVDAGVVDNTATATGKGPTGSTVTTNPSSTSTPVSQTTGLQLTKSAAVADLNGDGRTDLGDRVSWSFLVKNTGTTTLSTVSVTDPTAGPVSCPVTTLAPAASTTCVATTAHVVTQADVDAGVVHNTATAAGTDPKGTTVPSNPSSTTTPVSQTTGLQLTKSAAVADADGDGRTDLGDQVSWSFLVKNTGTTTLSTVSVIDPTAGPVSCPVTSLAPGASTTCTGITAHVVSQTDVDAGVVHNTATASGQDPKGNTVPSNPSSTDTPVVQTAALSLTKSATVADVDGDFRIDLGDTIQWQFLVKNTGTTTVGTIAVTDPKAGPVTCPTTVLAPGASTTCTAVTPHTITQADVDAGVVSNIAVANGTDPKGGLVPSNPSSTDTPIDQTAGLLLTKSAAVTDVDGDGKTGLGDQVGWSFLVRNTGTTTVTTLAVADPIAGAVTCPTTVLAPGASTTCAAVTPHTITQADVDAGLVHNVATASGKNPKGTTVPSNPSTTDTPVDQTAELVLTKRAAVADVNNDGRNDLGDTIQWSFLVENTGTTTLSTVSVTDPTAGAVTCPVTTLAPGAATTCVATTQYVVRQGDVDLGVANNTASALATGPSGLPVPSNQSSTSTPIFQRPIPTLTKTATVTDVNGNGQTDLGDRVTWGFVVENTGTVTLSIILVDDPTAGAVTCPTTVLAPGESMTCSAAPHTITQTDVDAGFVDNTAIAHALTPTGTPVTSNPSSTHTPVEQAPALELTKSAAVIDVDGDGKTGLGDTIQWSLLLADTGTTTITDLAVSDPTAGAVTCPVTSLAPGESTTCTAAPHQVTQADVDAGVVSNTATGTGTDPKGHPVPTDPSTTETPVDQAPALELTKSAAVTDVDGDGQTDLGDTIAWSFVVRNSGTTTLTGLAVSDPIAGAVTCPVTSLAPGESTTCTATTAHVVTQADVDAGAVDNTATASGRDPKGKPTTSNPSSTHTVVDVASAVQLVKHAAIADRNGDGRSGVGDRITWTFTVTNVGTQTLHSVSVTDPTAGSVTCPPGSLAPGVSTTCTADATHLVTQADVDAGFVANTATAAAKDPAGTPVGSNRSSTDTPLDQVAALRLVKQGVPTDTNGDGVVDAGDSIRWTFTATNIGLVTIDAVAVSDPKAGPVTCQATTLAPGESTTCTADNPYVVTAAEAGTGAVHNVATVSGDCTCGVRVPPSRAAAVVHTTAVQAVKIVVPGLPFTGAMGVVWGVRGGLALMLLGGVLLLVTRRRRSDEEADRARL